MSKAERKTLSKSPGNFRSVSASPIKISPFVAGPLFAFPFLVRPGSARIAHRFFSLDDAKGKIEGWRQYL